MLCPYCGNEMKIGKAQNISTNHTTLMFKEVGEEIRFRDIFKKEQIGAIVVAGTENDAYYCSKCKKLVLITDCM